MAGNVRMGDRRGQMRYGVTGQLWGTLGVRAPVVLKNLAAGGALIETTLTTGLKSLRTAQVVLRERGPELNVVVRHMRPVSPQSGHENRYLVGLEFVNLSPAARADVDRVLREWQANMPERT
jgi:c-di-GMP-binding flagellar brake protein YcgR